MTFGDAWLGIDAPPAPRRPVAGWVDDGVMTLEIGKLGRLLIGRPTDAAPWWSIELRPTQPVAASSADAAQLAAEDALRAVLVDAAAALGLRVVPS